MLSASVDSDQTARMRRLIRVYAGRTCHKVSFYLKWLMYIFTGNDTSNCVHYNLKQYSHTLPDELNS